MDRPPTTSLTRDPRGASFGISGSVKLRPEAASPARLRTFSSGGGAGAGRSSSGGGGAPDNVGGGSGGWVTRADGGLSDDPCPAGSAVGLVASGVTGAPARRIIKAPSAPHNGRPSEAPAGAPRGRLLSLVGWRNNAMADEDSGDGAVIQSDDLHAADLGRTAGAGPHGNDSSWPAIENGARRIQVQPRR